VIIRPASSQAQDRESSPVKHQRSTTVLRRQLNALNIQGLICKQKCFQLATETVNGQIGYFVVDHAALMQQD